MPTVLLVDVSLSMCRPVLEECKFDISDENNDIITRKTLAVMGCNQLLDHLSHHCKLEFTSLIIFSSLYEVVIPFTRDLDTIKEALSNMDDYDKTNLQVGLVGASQHILEEWGNGTPCQIVLITDGSVAASRNSFLNRINLPHFQGGSSQMPLPFPFPSKLNIVCVTDPEDSDFKLSQSIYRKLLDLNGEGNLYVPSKQLNSKNVGVMFDNLIKDNFSTYNGVMNCGNLSAHISLSPPPQPYFRLHDFEVVRETVPEQINICGFLNVADISSPSAFSRHLVLPSITKTELVAFSKDAGSDDECIDEGKVPSFCVLLHGGLKRENKVALCQLSPNWFAIFYSWADNKKKSNLMLSIFEPGTNVIPWVGRLTNLGPAGMLASNPYTLSENSTPFPLKVAEKKSYAQNCVVWVRQGGLHADVQKILRHARKLPEKIQSFYKELNRVRKAALMYGFPELLSGLANLLERECYSLPSSAHPDASIQLQHASECLRMGSSKDARTNIAPFKSI